MTEQHAKATTSSTQDVIGLLTAQHAQVKALFARLEGAKGAAAEESFCELRRMLSVHETAEEEVIYPAVKMAGDDGKKIAKARLQEEGKAKDVLSELESMEPGSPAFTSRLAQFKQMVLDHAGHEEREAFPVLRRSQSAEQLARMARVVELAEKAAPTHPHPHGPESAVGNMVVGPAVAIMDRVRDALHRAS